MNRTCKICKKHILRCPECYSFITSFIGKVRGKKSRRILTREEAIKMVEIREAKKKK